MLGHQLQEQVGVEYGRDRSENAPSGLVHRKGFYLYEPTLGNHVYNFFWRGELKLGDMNTCAYAP